MRIWHTYFTVSDTQYKHLNIKNSRITYILTIMPVAFCNIVF